MINTLLQLALVPSSGVMRWRAGRQTGVGQQSMLMVIVFYSVFYVCCARRLALVRANVKEGGGMDYVGATQCVMGLAGASDGTRNEKRERER